jgi:hypothetical protein
MPDKSSARTPIVCHMTRPAGVAVSIASVSEWNFTPIAQAAARRSSFHTRRVTVFRFFQASPPAMWQHLPYFETPGR